MKMRCENCGQMFHTSEMVDLWIRYYGKTQVETWCLKCEKDENWHLKTEDIMQEIDLEN